MPRRHPRRAPEYEPFVLPVAKYIPSYTSHIARPMDLHTMCLNCDRQVYSRAAAFEADLDLIKPDKFFVNAASNWELVNFGFYESNACYHNDHYSTGPETYLT